MREYVAYTPVLILTLTALAVYLASDPTVPSPMSNEPGAERARSQRVETADAPSPSTADPDPDSVRPAARTRPPAATTADPTFGSRPLPAPVRLETPVPFPEVTRRRMQSRMRKVLADYGRSSEPESFDLTAARLEIRRRLAALDAETASDRIADHPYLDLLGPLAPDLVPNGADRSGVRLFPVRASENGDTVRAAVPEPGFWSVYPAEIPETTAAAGTNGL